MGSVDHMEPPCCCLCLCQTADSLALQNYVVRENRGPWSLRVVKGLMIIMIIMTLI